ncbi:HlyD family efflux transporter periplasmic adaptor subunit [Shimia sagamensis]|uniref:HlyD family efflux transporter periplasmic adaptor subunit n=1 Tax=Shimia sagamensis TaxID=1566352 RepID=UPI0024B7BEF8|nr:HlyD family efflux transporter periplasmic adaptor subunit [Shimia sagamensis]
MPRQITRPLWFGFLSLSISIVVFVLWSTMAPLATSIPASGHLDARRPSLDIQHQFGGKIAEVHVVPHTTVVKGQLLIRLDVTDAKAELAEVHAALAPMQEERTVLGAALNNTLHETSSSIGTQTELAHARMKNMQDALQMRADMTTALEAALRQRAKRLRTSLDYLDARRRSMDMRLERYVTLAAQGALRTAEIDALKEAILGVESGMAREQAELVSLESQATQARLQVAREKLEFRQRILDRQAQLEEDIPRLRLQILRLSAQIAQADIVAPDDGVIAAFPYDTETMVVPKGETVLTLARPNGDLDVAFVASPQAIDQLRVGMEGVLTVTSLPQRNHPKVRVILTSLSPEARRNSDGAVMGYDGIAIINDEDQAALRAEMGDRLTLAQDMPVHLVFTGRHLTFGDYLVGPFLRFLSQAMQD